MSSFRRFLVRPILVAVACGFAAIVCLPSLRAQDSADLSKFGFFRVVNVMSVEGAPTVRLGARKDGTGRGLGPGEISGINSLPAGTYTLVVESPECVPSSLTETVQIGEGESVFVVLYTEAERKEGVVSFAPKVLVQTQQPRAGVSEVALVSFSGVSPLQVQLNGGAFPLPRGRAVEVPVTTDGKVTVEFAGGKKTYEFELGSPAKHFLFFRDSRDGSDIEVTHLRHVRFRPTRPGVVGPPR